MVSKLSKHQDPIATVLSSVVGVLGALGLVERLGLTGDQVAEIMGFAMAIIAAIRTVFERRKFEELEDLRAHKIMTTAPDPVRSPPGNVEGEIEDDPTSPLEEG